MKSSWKSVAMLILMSLMVILMVGCSTPQQPAQEAIPAVGDGDKVEGTDAEKKLTVGFVVMDVSNPYFAASIEGAQALCDAKGYELIVVDGAGDPAKQVQGMEDLMNRGCDAIDLRCVDDTAMVDVLKRAVDMGIKVNTYPDLEIATTVQKYDDYDQGYQLAETAAKWINERLGGTAEVAFLTQPSNSSVMKRVDGFKAALAEFCPGAEIAAEVEGWIPDVGMSATESILMAHPNVRIILGVNDSGALGAYEAVVSSNLPQDDFFIGGIDGDEAAIDKVAANSVYRCSVAGALTVPDIQWKTMENLINAALGLDYTRECVIDVLPVTIENVEEYKKLGSIYF